MDEPKVSIVVPVYNVESYLPYCLRSILNQTYQNLELIVVDDKSTDSSAALAEALLSGSSVCSKLLRNDRNVGLSPTRNNGMAVATGKYITFIDADDAVNRQYIEHLVFAAEHEQVDLVMSAHTEITDFAQAELDIPAYRYEKKHYAKKADVMREHGYAWGWLYRRDAIEKRGLLFVPVYMEDILWNTNYLLNVEKVGCASSAVYYFYKRAGSLSRPGSRTIVAKRTLEAAKAFDSVYLKKEFEPCSAEILQDRRYLRNCFFGENELIKPKLSCREIYGEKAERAFLRNMIRASSLGTAEKLREWVLSFSRVEWIAYRLLLRG